jgi:hypothetical protein
VKVENTAGEFVSPTDRAIAAGVKDMRSNPDGITRWVNFTKKDPKAYPLPMLVYLVTQTNVTSKFDATQGLPLRAFLRFALGPGQKHPPAGYSALPNDMRASSLRVVSLVPDQEYVVPPSPTPTTTLPPIPTIGPTTNGQGPIGPSGPLVTGTPPFTTATPTLIAGSPAPGITPQVLPPSVLSSEKSSYVWPIVLAVGLVALLLGPGSLAGSRLMARRKRTREERGPSGRRGPFRRGRGPGGDGGDGGSKGPNGGGPKHAAAPGTRSRWRRKRAPADDDLPSLREVPVAGEPADG